MFHTSKLDQPEDITYTELEGCANFTHVHTRNTCSMEVYMESLFKPLHSRKQT